MPPTIGLAERLVWFWSNHFCISADKIQSMSGAYEREAIRPHVLGRFADMLLAVEGHPAMLFYLDNTVSMGANSIAGINRSRGLNENFAREILELHTLGVRSGYTQDDVISFANVLTGWTLVPPGDNPEHGGEFTFNPRLHEPGAQTVMGKVYEEERRGAGPRRAAGPGVHPATATHVATKLARHFIADDAAAGAGRADGEGLSSRPKAISRRSRRRWCRLTKPGRGPPTKLKRPGEWVVGMVRADRHHAGRSRRGSPAGQALLGERLWRPPSPKGYPDDEATWIDGMGRRLDVANNFAERVAGRVDPQDVIEDVLGSRSRPR